MENFQIELKQTKKAQLIFNSFCGKYQAKQLKMLLNNKLMQEKYFLDIQQTTLTSPEENFPLKMGESSKLLPFFGFQKY